MNSPVRNTNDADRNRSQAPLALALPPDAELVAQLRHADEAIARKAFSAIYNAYCRRLYEYAYYLTRNQVVAEEVVADVLAGIWHRREQWNPERAIDAYLFGAVRLQVWEEHRRTHRRSALTDYFVPSGESPGMSTSSATLDAEREELASGTSLRNALDSLSGRARAAVMYRWYDGLEFSEIAERLGTTEGAVRVMISRALKTLRIILRSG